jgi:two-component system phosphate regulon sensor histidine kinase PhoR
LSELCESVIKTLSDKAKSKNIKIDYSGDTSLVYGIKPILYEMVYNLCDNAINYNKVNGSVTVKLQNESGKTILSVADTGIAPEHRDRIFERFYRVDKSHSKDTGGTGLGLAIVKHVTILHNAEIALESQEGKGTTITVSFKKQGAHCNGLRFKNEFKGKSQTTEIRYSYTVSKLRKQRYTADYRNTCGNYGCTCSFTD